MTTLTPEQPIIDHLHAEIESANARLESLDSQWRIFRHLSVYDVDGPLAPKRETPTPEPKPQRPPVVGDTVICADCAALLPAAGCQPCHECGSASKGCA
jgi:hypothetical protein